MKTWGTSETSVPRYATIWITEYGNPQTRGCRKLRNPLLKPDCHLLYKHDSLSQAVPSVQYNWEPIQSVFVSSYPKPRSGFKRHPELPVRIARTEYSLTTRATDCTGPTKWPRCSRSQLILPNNTTQRCNLPVL